jgi:hypothetical protein
MHDASIGMATEESIRHSPEQWEQDDAEKRLFVHGESTERLEAAVIFEDFACCVNAPGAPE